MWVRKEVTLLDHDAEMQKYKLKHVKEDPLTWNEFRILQSTKTKDLVTEYKGELGKHRDTGIKIQRQQLVLMQGKDFRGEISNFAIWLPNNSKNGSITETLKDYSPSRNLGNNLEFELDECLPQLFDLRKQCMKTACRFEHLFLTWNTLVSDNETTREIGQITPDRVSTELDQKLSLLPNSGAILAFHKRLDAINDKSESGYNPSDDFFGQIADLIWESSVQCPIYAVNNQNFTTIVAYAIKAALINDLGRICQGNEPSQLNVLESPIMGMEINLNTELYEIPEYEVGSPEEEWTPKRRSRLSCALPGI